MEQGAAVRLTVVAVPTVHDINVSRRVTYKVVVNFPAEYNIADAILVNRARDGYDFLPINSVRKCG